MNQLPPDARDLLRHVRAEQARSTPEMRARVRAGITRATLLVPLTHASPAAAKSKLTSGSLLKLAAATATVAAFAGLGLYEKPPAAVPTERPRLQQQAVPPEQPALPPAPTLPSALTLPSATERAIPRAPLRDDLSAELQLIERAQLALKSGDAQAALQALRVHRARFGRGQLAAEREGLLLIASCVLDQPGARERAAHRASSAVSPLLEERIAHACTKP